MGFRRAFKRKTGGAYIRGAYNRTEKKNFKTSYIWIQVHLHLSGSTPPPPWRADSHAHPEQFSKNYFNSKLPLN